MASAAKTLLVWLVMVAAAILNGLLREQLLAPVLKEQAALALSGLSLSCLIILIIYVMLPLLKVSRIRECLLLGAFWVVLTLCFEYLFGYFVVGRPLAEINRVFSLTEGNLFILVLVVTLFAPWLCARARRML